MNAERTAVLIDMTFNLGSVRWPKLTAAIKKKDWANAAKEIMDSKYANDVGERARRNACIMRDGTMYTKTN
jgi:lysozyme